MNGHDEDRRVQAVAPGTIGLSRIGGPTGWWVSFGQWLTGDGSRFTHAFVVLDDDTVVEAMPGGARVAPLPDRLAWRPLAFGTGVRLTGAQRVAIVARARELVGTPYSFLDYVYLAAVHVTGAGHAGGGPVVRWLRRRVAGNGRMICSQLVDECYRYAGVHLFDDGRAPQDVTPGDLAGALIEWRGVGTDDR